MINKGIVILLFLECCVGKSLAQDDSARLPKFYLSSSIVTAIFTRSLDLGISARVLKNNTVEVIGKRHFAPQMTGRVIRPSSWGYSIEYSHYFRRSLKVLYSIYFNYSVEKTTLTHNTHFAINGTEYDKYIDLHQNIKNLSASFGFFPIGKRRWTLKAGLGGGIGQVTTTTFGANDEEVKYIQSEVSELQYFKPGRKYVFVLNLDLRLVFILFK